MIFIQKNTFKVRHQSFSKPQQNMYIEITVSAYSCKLNTKNIYHKKWTHSSRIINTNVRVYQRNKRLSARKYFSKGSMNNIQSLHLTFGFDEKELYKGRFYWVFVKDAKTPPPQLKTDINWWVFASFTNT